MKKDKKKDKEYNEMSPVDKIQVEDESHKKFSGKIFVEEDGLYYNAKIYIEKPAKGQQGTIVLKRNNNYLSGRIDIEEIDSVLQGNVYLLDDKGEKNGRLIATISRQRHFSTVAMVFRARIGSQRLQEKNKRNKRNKKNKVDSHCHKIESIRVIDYFNRIDGRIYLYKPQQANNFPVKPVPAGAGDAKNEDNKN